MSEPKRRLADRAPRPDGTMPDRPPVHEEPPPATSSAQAISGARAQPMGGEPEPIAFIAIAVDLGFITQAQGEAALEARAVDAAIGAAKPIGAYLYESGVTTKDQIGKVLKMMTRISAAPPMPIPAAIPAAKVPKSLAPPQSYYADQGPSGPPKSRAVFVLLGLFLGGLGVHNFYAGYTGRGIAQLLIMILTGWTGVGIVVVGIWALIEIITVTTDANGEQLV